MEWLIYVNGKEQEGRVVADTMKDAVKAWLIEHPLLAGQSKTVHATSWIPYTAKYKHRPKPEPDAGLGGGPDGTDDDGGED